LIVEERVVVSISHYFVGGICIFAFAIAVVAIAALATARRKS
jgi:hypothetical protein